MKIVYPTIGKRLFVQFFLLFLPISFNNFLFGKFNLFFLDNNEYLAFGNSLSHFSPPFGYCNSNISSITAVNRRPYDVINYNLYLDWYNPLSRPNSIDSIDKVWNGRNRITMVPLVESLNSIELDARELIIDSVFIVLPQTTQKVIPTPKIQDRKLTIPLPQIAEIGDTIDLEIYYTYSRNIGFNQYRGFYLYPKGMFVGRLPAPFYDSVFVEEKLAYTMSEPEDARFWMPCNDSPVDKAMSKITVRVPYGYTVASNGYLEKVISDSDSAFVFYWISDKPITTYLMAVTASKYVMYQDWYKLVTNPTDSIPVQYYVWEKDFNSTKTDGSEYNARNTFQTTVSMMEFFSKVFIEYPFIKYGMVSIMPFNFGGMEHQTISSINRVWLRQNSQFGIAHELAHQWIGDLVTCASWDDIWFNEGGATWSEALYAEKLWGNSSYNWFKLTARANYLKAGGLNLPAIYSLPVNTIFGDNAVLVYQKASWIYHMLQKTLGDSLFFSTFRSFLKDFAYQSIESKDFIEYLKNHIPNPPIDFDIFFDQWLFKAGHPVFSLNTEINAFTNDTNYHNAKITLFQIQSGNNVPEVFKTPVKLIFKNQDEEYSLILLDTTRVQQFSLALPFFPDSIFIDTTYILCEVSNIFLSVKNENRRSEGIIYPNPVISSSPFTFVLFSHSIDFGEIAIFDLLGNKVLKLFEGKINIGENSFYFETDGLVRGIYQVCYYGTSYRRSFTLLVH